MGGEGSYHFEACVVEISRPLCLCKVLLRLLLLLLFKLINEMGSRYCKSADENMEPFVFSL